MNNTFAPICFFTYNRIRETQKSIEALKKNYLASKTDLFIFSDGFKNEIGRQQVEEVKQYINTITGFKSVTIYDSQINKGLANSIISGVSQIIEKYENVIVLEDDLVTSPNFLDFMNQALSFYKDDMRIFSISGYTMDLPELKGYHKDYYLGYRASSWGWGTWKDRWDNIDWEVKEYSRFRNQPIKKLKFMRGGSDLPGMLKSQMKGRVDSWAIRWCFHQFQNNLLTIFPSKSKVISIGFGEKATHTKKTKRFDVRLDHGMQTNFTFSSINEINSKITKEFKEKFSIINRLKDKLISLKYSKYIENSNSKIK